MATVLLYLADITESNIDLILREYESMPQPEYGNACLRARNASAALCRPTWSMHSMAHINALLLGLSKLKYNNSYAIMKLMAATECYSFGIMGQCGLEFEDFNLAIGPLASVFSPELFAEAQTWMQEPVPKIEYVRPPYRHKSRVKTGDSGVDIVGLVDTLVKESGLARPPVSASAFHADQSETADAVDAILANMKVR